MIKIGICDDEQIVREILNKKVKICLREADVQAEKRYIGVKVHMGDEDFSIEVCNSARQRKLAGADGLSQTTKKNLKNHGYGLKNIKEAVERNHGIFLWQSTEEKFSVKVILPLRLRG